MTNVKILETNKNRLGKVVPIKLSIPCSVCGKEAIIAYDSSKRNWSRSPKVMKQIFQAIENDVDYITTCSRSCGNVKRDHSYMKKMNETFTIFCKDCDKECEFRDDQPHKGSVAIKCYTFHNRTAEEIGFKSGDEWNGKPNGFTFNIEPYYGDKTLVECCKEWDSGVKTPKVVEKRYGVWTYKGIDPLTDKKYPINKSLLEVNGVVHYHGKPWIDWCKDWDEGVSHPKVVEKIFGLWTYKGINSLTNDIIPTSKGLFKINNVIYYHGKPWVECCKEWDEGASHPKIIEKRYGIWTYDGIDPLTQEKLYKKKYMTYKGVKYYNGVPWEEFKSTFISSDLTKSSIFASISESYPNVFEQPTYRVSNEAFINKVDMEEDLVEKGVEWFAYVKFWVAPDCTVKPLVAGKTGSKLVNASGSDINFSLSIDNPSIAFIREVGGNWWKESILVIPAASEEHAYEIESDIAQTYGLF